MARTSTKRRADLSGALMRNIQRELDRLGQDVVWLAKRVHELEPDLATAGTVKDWFSRTKSHPHRIPVTAVPAISEALGCFPSSLFVGMVRGLDF